MVMFCPNLFCPESKNPSVLKHGELYNNVALLALKSWIFSRWELLC